MSRLDSDTIKVRPTGYAGSFYAHIEYGVDGKRRTGPVGVSFSCQPKHEGTDLGKATESMSRRVYLEDNQVRLKPRLLEFLMPDAVPDDHPVVVALIEAAQKALDDLSTLQTIQSAQLGESK